VIKVVAVCASGEIDVFPSVIVKIEYRYTSAKMQFRALFLCNACCVFIGNEGNLPLSG